MLWGFSRGTKSHIACGLTCSKKKTVFKEGMGVYITLYPLHAEDHRSIGKLHMNTIDDTQEIPKY